LKTSNAAKPNRKLTPNEAMAELIAGPRTMSAMLPKLTSKAFEKHGFPASALLMDWAEIAGPDLAGFTRPEKLNWPRRPRNELAGIKENPPGGISSGGATLILRVDGPRAIEVQHSATQIKEQINAYFGYRAITELRFLQAPITTELPRATIKPKSDVPKVAPATVRNNAKPASKLDATLARLAENLELAE